MKKIFAVLLILIFAIFLSGCNKQIIDLTYNYEDGDQLQVKIDGVMYLTHANNVVLEAR